MYETSVLEPGKFYPKSSQQGLDVPFTGKMSIEHKTFDKRGYNKNKEKFKKSKIGKFVL